MRGTSITGTPKFVVGGGNYLLILEGFGLLEAVEG
jgi:protein-disulfide isomerase